MRAGQLRERVVLQRPMPSTDSGGGHPVTWATIDTLWAHVHAVGGREQIQAHAVTSNLSHLVTLRYRKGVDATMRLTWRRRVLQVASVAASDDRAWLELACVQTQHRVGAFAAHAFANHAFDTGGVA